jgi:hypothetical protein
LISGIKVDLGDSGMRIIKVIPDKE